MKNEIHPTYYKNTKVTCSCGAKFEIGSTIPELKVEICSACHPLYTGKKRFVDTAGRLDRFKAREEKTKKLQASLDSKRKTKIQKPEGETESEKTKVKVEE